MAKDKDTDTEEPTRESRTSIRRGLTRAAIVAATAEAIQRDGEEKFSLDEVAAGLGLSKPALYYYFSTREALLFEVFLAEMTNVAERIDAAVEATDNAVDAIEAFVRAMLDYHYAAPKLSRFLHRQPVLAVEAADADNLSRLPPINDLIMRGLIGRIKAARESGEATVPSARRLAFLTFTSVTGLLTVYDVIDAPNYEDLVEALIEMLQARLNP